MTFQLLSDNSITTLLQAIIIKSTSPLARNTLSQTQFVRFILMKKRSHQSNPAARTCLNFTHTCTPPVCMHEYKCIHSVSIYLCAYLRELCFCFCHAGVHTKGACRPVWDADSNVPVNDIKSHIMNKSAGRARVSPPWHIHIQQTVYRMRGRWGGRGKDATR